MHPLLHHNVYIFRLYSLLMNICISKNRQSFLWCCPPRSSVDCNEHIMSSSIIFRFAIVSTHLEVSHAQDAYAFSVSSFSFRIFFFLEERRCECLSALQKQQGRDQFPSPSRGRILIPRKLRKTYQNT